MPGDSILLLGRCAARPTRPCAGDVMLLRHRSLPGRPVSPSQARYGGEKEKRLHGHPAALLSPPCASSSCSTLFWGQRERAYRNQLQGWHQKCARSYHTVGPVCSRHPGSVTDPVQILFTIKQIRRGLHHCWAAGGEGEADSPSHARRPVG